MITFADVEQARKRIGDSVFLSPCAYSETLSKLTQSKIWLKLENLQMTGSFKERGACNKLKSLTPEERQAIIDAYPVHEREARTKGIPSMGLR